MLGYNMCYFDEVTFTTNVMRNKVCVDISDFSVFLVWGRVIYPLWGLKAPSPATKKWIFEFCTKFGFRNHLQTFWPRRLVKSELSLGLYIIIVFWGVACPWGQVQCHLPVKDK